MAKDVTTIAIFQHVLQSTWSGLVSVDTGTSLDASLYIDKCVQVGGVFSSGPAQLTIQGSNDGSSWFTLNDPQGNGLVFTTSGMEQILENPKFIRPVTASGATGTSLDVIIISRG